MYRIKDEGLQRSQVMDTAWYLTDVHGPRLTNSPDIRAAATGPSKRLTDGASPMCGRRRGDPSGADGSTSGSSPTCRRRSRCRSSHFRAHGRPAPNGPVTADAILAVIEREDDFKQWAGKLTGKFVLSQNPPEVRALFTPLGRALHRSGA